MSLRILIVDDEMLARAHMRRMIERCALSAPPVITEAAQASEALAYLAQRPADLLLLDIGMPHGDGVALARQLRGQPDAPAVVFVTGHASHAVAAFELDAVDYLTKPIGVDRLQQALHKTVRLLQGRQSQAAADAASREALLIQARGRSERVPLADVLYLKSEDKYLTVRTATHEHLFEGSLSALENAHPGRFVRAHRNALVARSAIRALVREGDDGAGWALRLGGIGELVPVSRRQLASVRQALKEI
ncbi:LytTR family DNA-binding domain-containing protein [soil metagenome]